MRNLFLIGISLVFCAPFAAAYSMKSGRIVYYCENKSTHPWDENANLECRGSFNNAVLGLLLYVDNNAEIKALSLESFDWDFEKKYYKLKLKENLYFHNNRKVTSKDLEFSILRHFFRKNPNLANTLQINLKGTEKIKQGQKYQSGLVEGVKILDDRTVAITPSKSNPSFLYTFAHYSFSLVPMEELKADLITWKKWPIGVGAYKVSEENIKKRSYLLSMISNKEYPKAPKEILYEQERIYEPDITVTDSIAAKSNKYLKEELLVPLSRKVFEFNFSSKLGKNKEFRRAIALALCRIKISKATDVSTIPLYELLTSGNIGRINIVEIQNLKEASKILKKELGKYNKKVFTIPYTEDNSYLGSKYKDEIKKQLLNVGLQIKFQEVRDNLWNPFTDEFKESPFYLVSTEADYFDPLLNFTIYSKESPAINSHPNDDLLESLLEETIEAPSRDILNERLKNISRYFYENRIVIPLFEVPNVAYYNPKKISSIGVQFGGIIFYLQNIEISDINYASNE